MEKTIQFNVSPDELMQIVIAGVRVVNAERESKGDPNKTNSINQVAKRLHRSHDTITKHIKQGRLQVIAGNRITDAAINDYLLSK